jgi:hypothetical protein
LVPILTVPPCSPPHSFPHTPSWNSLPCAGHTVLSERLPVVLFGFFRYTTGQSRGSSHSLSHPPAEGALWARNHSPTFLSEPDSPFWWAVVPGMLPVVSGYFFFNSRRLDSKFNQGFTAHKALQSQCLMGASHSWIDSCIISPRFIDMKTGLWAVR